MKKIGLFLLMYALGMFLSLNMNSKYKIHTYKSTMWADASGYYMYLPATILYQWDFNRMPSGMDTLTGNGFSLQRENQKIFTKYTSGISYLQLPFFLLAHLYTRLSGGLADGFSQPYVNSLLFAGVFYLILGLFFLHAVLVRFFPKLISVVSCIALVLCTNLYFYGIEHPGLTHVYSFCLISAALYLIVYNNRKVYLFLIPICALLFLIRPTNVLAIGMIAAFFGFYSGKTMLKHFTISNVVSGIATAVILILPQLFYWKYVSGNWLMYSYENEGFIYYASPKIMEVLFAASNGFFPYAPIFIFALIGFAYKPISKGFTIAFFVLFAAILYLNASWWSWPFGCAYGARAFIEYYPFLAIGLATFLYKYAFTVNWKKYTSIFVLVLLMAYNILLIYSYDDCFYGGTWDYNEILRLLFS